MTNREADNLINVFRELENQIKNGEILDYNLNYDEKTGVLDICIVPLKSVAFIENVITITPDGVKFDE
jgi:hypothetical protein